MPEENEFESIVDEIIAANGDKDKIISLIEKAMHKYNERPSPCVQFCEQNAYKSEINRLRMLCKEASDYLDTNDLTQIGSGSILHQKFKSEASYI